MDMKIELNKPQKIIFLMAFVAIVTIAVVWLFIYSPAKNEVKRLSREFKDIQSEIRKIEMISGGESNMDIAYEKLYNRYTELGRIIQTEERSTLSALSTEADRMGVEVLAVNPGKIIKSSLPLEVKGKTILEMPITMNIRCDYITLGEYLNILREKLPALVAVNSISINRPAGKDAPYLEVLLNITLFMLGGS